MSEFDIAVVLDEIESFRPSSGADLVGLDEMALPGNKLYFIQHFDSLDEANAAQKRSKVNSIVLEAKKEGS